MWIFRGALRMACGGDAAMTALLQHLIEWRWHVSQRDLLRSLDDRMLKDVGLTRADVEAELHKPFWR